MDHALRSCGRCFERGLVADVAPDDLDAQVTEPRGPVRVPGDRAHGQVVLAHAPDEMGADKAGAAGHEDHEYLRLSEGRRMTVRFAHSDDGRKVFSPIIPLFRPSSIVFRPSCSRTTPAPRD